MPTRYLSIVAEQSPFHYDVDENSRTLFSCNFSLHIAGPLGEPEKEIARLIEAEGLAVLGTNLFVGPASVISPAAGNGPFATVLSTGGTAPEETHNGDEYDHPSVQVIVRGKPYPVTQQLARDIYQLLRGLYGVTVSALGYMLLTEDEDWLSTEDGDALLLN